jgi:carboxylate-amine ligase
MDNRLQYYATNQKKIPSISGAVIPGRILSADQYRKEILETIYSDISPFDPQGVLQHEWLNSRGAIARFERSAIEIRVIDTQESSYANVAVSILITAAIRFLVQQKSEIISAMKPIVSVVALKTIYKGSVLLADSSEISDRKYLSLWDIDKPLLARELWSKIAYIVLTKEEKKDIAKFLKVYMSQGSLARRIEFSIKGDSSEKNILKVYRRLAKVLARDGMFNH